jgi:hypothetical protein
MIDAIPATRMRGPGVRHAAPGFDAAHGETLCLTALAREACCAVSAMLVLISSSATTIETTHAKRAVRALQAGNPPGQTFG